MASDGTQTAIKQPNTQVWRNTGVYILLNTASVHWNQARGRSVLGSKSFIKTKDYLRGVTLCSFSGS